MLSMENEATISAGGGAHTAVWPLEEPARARGVARGDVAPHRCPRAAVTSGGRAARGPLTPSGRSPGPAMPRVYIGRLSYQARERDVERFFKGYGKILEVDLKNG